MRENEDVGPRQGNERGPTFYHMPMTGGTAEFPDVFQRGLPARQAENPFRPTMSAHQLPRLAAERQPDRSYLKSERMFCEFVFAIESD